MSCDFIIVNGVKEVVTPIVKDVVVVQKIISGGVGAPVFAFTIGPQQSDVVHSVTATAVKWFVRINNTNTNETKTITVTASKVGNSATYNISAILGARISALVDVNNVGGNLELAISNPNLTDTYTINGTASLI